jgi:hypothetical protein
LFAHFININQVKLSNIVSKKGNLNGFGWAFNFNSPSPNVEHPTPSVLSQFMSKVPQDFYDSSRVGVLSTMHVYFDSTPRLNFC